MLPETPLRILLVEDNPGDALLISDAMEQTASATFALEHVERLGQAVARLEAAAYDAVLLDLSLPDSQGLATVATVQLFARGCPVLVLTGVDDELLALKALQAGAADYLVKGQVFGAMLARAVRHAVERGRAERSLRDAEARFRQLADHLSTAFWLREAATGRVLYVNPAYEAITGREMAALYADPASYLQAVHPDDRAQAAAPAGDTWDREYRMVRPDGQVRWVHDRGSVVRGPGGRAEQLAGFLEDVTDAHRAEEQIRLQASLLDAVGESVIATRLDGTIFYWNRAAERTIGWRADEVLGRSIMEVTVPDDAEVYARAAGIMAHLERGETWSGEFPVLRRDGSVFQALVTDAPIHDPDGRLIGIIGSSIDLTEQKQAEARARENELRYRELFDTMAQGVMVFDADRVVAANPAAEEILGLSLEEIRTRPLDAPAWRLYREDGALLEPANYPSIVALRASRELTEVVGIHNPREDRVRWLLVNARPQLRPGADRPYQSFTTFTDITRLREAEQALRRTAQELDAIVATTPLATIVVDTEFRVRLWNPAAERMFGWTADEILGQPYPLPGVGDTPPPEEVFTAAFAGHSVSGEEIRRGTRDGRVLDLSMWNAPLCDEDGNVRGLIGVMADITERRALEAQLLQSQKMEAVGLLAGGVAHDFNNILTAIQGFTDLLLADEHEGTDRHADLLEISGATGRAAALTRQLLAFSRKQVLRPALLDLNATVADLQKILGRVLGEDVELVTEAGPGVAHVRADRGQVEQVLLNLAVNARDAMPTGGVLRIETRNVVLTPENALRHGHPLRPGMYVRVAVADTGAGMPPEVLTRVFEPFFTTKPVGQGTGLGLSTVYGIVKQSGGYVSVDSEVGKGTTFSIYFPAAGNQADDAPAPERLERAPAAGTETVLVVEDDEAVRELALRVLRSRGYRVLEACDGENALEVLRTVGRVDLILSDVVMPRMSGPEFTRFAAAGEGAPPVLFMSGYPDHMLARHSVSAGEIHLIEKPFTAEQLARRVRTVIDRARAA
jgi:PAS domain S-box-containing protein